MLVYIVFEKGSGESLLFSSDFFINAKTHFFLPSLAEGEEKWDNKNERCFHQSLKKYFVHTEMLIKNTRIGDRKRQWYAEVIPAVYYGNIKKPKQEPAYV